VLKTAIVGCGNIAGFLDHPKQDEILTHAHAYQAHPNTQLVAVCDPDVVQRQGFTQVWGQDIRHYESLSKLLEKHPIDMLSICSPTSHHATALIQALKDPKIRIILCEKPFVQTQEELDELKILLPIHKKKVLINYLRRFDPSIQKVKLLLGSGDLGKVLHFTAKFTKGLYHNGSHMLELIEHLLGSITKLKALSMHSYQEDIYGHFFLSTPLCEGIIQNLHGDDYALFELEIICSKGRVLIKDSAHLIEIQKVQPSSRYQGYFELGCTSQMDDTMRKNLYHSVDYAIKNKQDSFPAHLALSQKLLDIKTHLETKNQLHWSSDA
jgi:predicted dehydrogenase